MTPDAMAALHAACFTAPRPWTAPEFVALLAQPGTLCATDPDGLLLGRLMADEAEVLTLAVAPAARRRGLGARLLRTFLADAAARGAVRVHLEVSCGNAGAIALYARAGFRQAGIRKGYVTGGGRPAQDAAVLVVALPQRDGGV